MKKKFLSIFLALTMCLSLLPTSAFATGVSTNYINKNGESISFPSNWKSTSQVTEFEDNSFYVISEDNFSRAVSVGSNVSIVLMDHCAGVTLTLTGTAGSSTLDIYAGVTKSNNVLGTGTCAIESIDEGVTVTLYGGTYTRLPESGWALGESFCFRTENESAEDENEEDEGAEGVAYTYSTVFSEGATVVYCPDVDEDNEKYHKYADPYTDGKCLNCGHVCNHNWPPVDGTRSITEDGKCSYCRWQYPVCFDDRPDGWNETLDANLNGSTAKLYADINDVMLGQRKAGYTIDLNGHTLTQADQNYVDNDNIVIKDSSEEGGGTIKGLFKITGGSVQLHAGVTLADGIKTTASGATLLDYLAEGTAYAIDGTVVDGSGTSLTGTVKIVAHTHDFTGGTCECGHECPHTGVAAGDTCDVCGATLKTYEAQIVDGDKYETFKAALENAKDGDTVELLKDVTVEGLSASNNLPIEKAITLDLGEYSLSYGNQYVTVESDVTIKANGGALNGLTVKSGDVTLNGVKVKIVDLKGDGSQLTLKNTTIENTIYVGGENAQDAVTLVLESGSVGDMHVRPNAAVTLSGGSFDQIIRWADETNGSDGDTGYGSTEDWSKTQTFDQMLAKGYAYQYTGDENKDEFVELSKINGIDEMMLENVKVVECKAHNWDNKDGVCAYCGYECEHTDEDDETCGTCGATLKVTEYDVWVLGTQVTSANKNDVLAGDTTNAGKVSYDPSTKTLTLNGVNLEYAGESAIEAKGDLTVVATNGANIIKLIPRGTDGYTQCGIKVVKAESSTTAPTLTIKGGALFIQFADDASSKRDCAYGIYVEGNVAIKQHTAIDVNSGNATHMSYGIYAKDGDVTIGEVNGVAGFVVGAYGGKVTSTDRNALSRGIVAESVTITGGAVMTNGGTATSTTGDAHSNGIYATNISISGKNSVYAPKGTATAGTGKTATNGGIYVADNGKLTISDTGGENITATIAIETAATGSVELSGGSYNALSTLDDTTLASYLATGKAFAGTTDNSIVDGYKTSLENVKIVAHSHSYTDGVCACGYVCDHKDSTDPDKCTICGKQIYVAQIGTQKYETFNEAYTAAQSGDTITLLADAEYEYTLDNSSSEAFETSMLEMSRDITLTIDLGTHNLKAGDPDYGWMIYQGNYTLKNGTIKWSSPLTVDYEGKLTLGDNISIGYLSLGDGTLAVTGDNVNVGTLRLVGTNQAKTPCALTKGTFGAIEKANNAAYGLSDLLTEGYAFKSTSGNTWYDKYNNSSATEIKNVTVTAVPVKSLSISTTDSKTRYTYGESFTLTATTVEDASYQWYTVSNETETAIGNATGATYSPANLSVGTHTFRVKVTKDGYAKSASVTVTVTKATLGDAFYPALSAKTGLTYSGSPQTLISGLEDQDWFTYEAWKADMGAEFMFRVNDGTWSADLPTATDAGNYTVYWYIKGGDNYNDVGSETSPAGSVNVTIARKTVEHPAIVFGNSNQISYTYTGSEIKPAFTLYDDDTVIPASEYTVSYDDNTDACNYATVTVTCTNGGNYNFVAVTRTFEITKADQTITVPVDKTIPKNHVGVDISTWATAVGVIDNDATVGALTYTLDRGMTGVSLENNTLTADNTVSVGAEIVVKVTAAATDNYNEASTTFIVRVTELPKATCTTPSVNSLTYDGTEQALVKAGTATGGTMQYRLGVNGNWTETIPTGKDAGEYAVFYKVVGDEEHSDSDVDNVTVTIDPQTLTKADLEYTGAAISKTYDGSTDCDLTEVSVKDGVVCGSDTLTISGTAVYDSPNVYEAKKVIFTPAAITTGNYRLEASEKLEIDASITSKTVMPSVTVAGGSTYDGKPKTPDVNVMVGTGGLIKDEDYTVSYENNVNAGTNTAKAIVTAKENRNYTWEPVTENFSIEKAAAPSLPATTTVEIVYTLTPYTIDLSQVITGMPTDAGTVSYSLPDGVDSMYSINDNILTIDDDTYGAGGYYMVSVYVSSTNYKNSMSQVNVYLIDKTAKPLTVSMTGWTYGDTAKAPQYTKPDGAGDATVQYKAQGAEDDTYTTDVPTNAGNYTVKVVCETNTERYTGTANFTVARKDISGAVIELAYVTDTEKVYDGNEKTRTVTGVKLGDKTLTADTDYTVGGQTSGKNAGDYTITVTGEGNYTGTATTTWTIKQKAITANVSVAEKEYDGTNTATVTVSFDLNDSNKPVDGDSIEVTGVTGTFDNKNVGTGKTVTIDSTKATITGTGSENYKVTFPYSADIGVIKAKPVTATVTVAEKTYDGTTNATVTAEVTTGVIDGDSIAITGLTGTFDNANVGTDKTVAIDASGKNITGNGSGNYDVTIPATAKGTIKAAKAIVITAPEANTLTYNSGAQALVTAGTASGGTMQYSLDGEHWSDSVPTGTNATGYTVWYKAVGDSNHSDSDAVSIPVTIGTAALTVTANDKAITYGEAPANDGVEYSGFVNGEDASVLTGTLGYDYSYAQYGNVGSSYTITPKGLTSGNYTIEFKPGTLTVSQKEVGLDWTDTTLTYTGSAQKPTATATGLVNSDTCTVIVSGEQTDAGANYTATAVSLSNNNYKLPESGLTTRFSIAEASLTGVSAEQSGTLTYNGAPQTATVAATATTVDGSAVSFTYSDTENGTYSENVPAFTTGTHTVWYKASAANHATASGSFTVTIGKTSVTITAANKSAYTYASAPDLNSPVEGTDYTLSGLIGEDTLDTVTVVLTCEADMSKTGSYDIVPSVTGEDVRYDFTFVNGKLTVSNRPSSSSSTVTVPVSSDHASVEVKATVSKGNATVEVSDKQIEKVAADGAGNVTLDVSSLKNVESATVPSHVVEKTNKAEDTGLTVALPTGSVTLDETALESVTENADGKDVTVSVVAVPTANLSSVVKNIIGMETTVVAVVDVNVTISGKKQSSFDGGKVTISVPYTPKKGEDTSKLTVWFIKDDGTIENKGGYYDAKNKCFVFETDHLSQYLLVNTNELVSFTDVSADAWYAPAVNWAVKQNITGGIGNNLFAPDASCTRAQIVTFLWRAAGSPEPKTASSFADVPTDAYYAKAVAWAVENGITGGIGNNQFAPDLTCTRAQAAAFLFRYAAANGMEAVTLQELAGGYGDAAQVPGYALPAFNWALAQGIVNGNNGNLMPNNDCTRAQIVTMLYRLLGTN